MAWPSLPLPHLWHRRQDKGKPDQLRHLVQDDGDSHISVGRSNLVEVNEGIKVDGTGERERVHIPQFKGTIDRDTSEQPDPIPINEKDWPVFLEQVFPGGFFGGCVGGRGWRRGCRGRGREGRGRGGADPT